MTTDEHRDDGIEPDWDTMREHYEILQDDLDEDRREYAEAQAEAFLAAHEPRADAAEDEVLYPEWMETDPGEHGAF